MNYILKIKGFCFHDYIKSPFYEWGIYESNIGFTVPNCEYFHYTDTPKEKGLFPIPYLELFQKTLPYLTPLYNTQPDSTNTIEYDIPCLTPPNSTLPDSTTPVNMIYLALPHPATPRQTKPSQPANMKSRGFITQARK
jgi:hypothetical protein